MATEEEQIQSLIDIIGNMVPSKEKRPRPEREPRPLHDLLHPLRPAASFILRAKAHMPDELGKTVDNSHYEDLASALESTRTALSHMPEPVRSNLMFHAGLLSFSSEAVGECNDGLKEFEDQVKNLLKVIEGIQTARERLDPPHPRTNWRAISVFEACLAVWKDETKKRAPTLSAHTEYTSPFGIFVKSVFELLGIGSSPRVAQDGLARWRREQTEIT